MIAEEDLKNIANFGLCEEGYYSDYSDYMICPNNKERTKWTFRIYSEVDGSSWHIKNLKDIYDLENLYLAITNKPIEYFIYTDSNGNRYTENEKEKYLLNQDYIDGIKIKCSTCKGVGSKIVKYNTKQDDIEKHLTNRVNSKFFVERISHLSPTYWEIEDCIYCKGLGYFDAN